MGRMIFILFLLLKLTNSNEQVFYAKYKCTFRSPEKNGVDTITEKNLAKLLAPLMVFIYTVYADDHFLELSGELESIESGENIRLKRTGPTKLIIDLKNNLVYSPEENKFQSLYLYELEDGRSVDQQTAQFHLRSFDSLYVITISKTLPKMLTPAVFLKNNPNGIQSVSTVDFSINLLEWKVADKKLDYASVFKPQLGKAILDTFRLNEF